MFFYIVLTPISTTSGLWSTGNTRKYHQIDVNIYQCDVGLKSLLRQELSEPELYGDLRAVYTIIFFLYKFIVQEKLTKKKWQWWGVHTLLDFYSAVKHFAGNYTIVAMETAEDYVAFVLCILCIVILRRRSVLKRLTCYVQRIADFKNCPFSQISVRILFWPDIPYNFIFFY